MRTLDQSFALIDRQLENNERHLRQYSSRIDMAEGNRLALKELALIRDQVTGYQSCLQSQEQTILKMRRIWSDHLLKVHLYLSSKDNSSQDFLRVLGQPIDLLIMPFEAALKSEVKVTHLDLTKYSPEENMAMLENIQSQYIKAEHQVQNNLMLTKYQINSIITQSLNR